MDKQPLTITMPTDVWDETKAKIAELGDKVKSQREHIIEITTYSKETLAKIKAQAIRDMVSSMLPKFGGINSKLVVKNMYEYADKLEQDDE